MEAAIVLSTIGYALIAAWRRKAYLAEIEARLTEGTAKREDVGDPAVAAVVAALAWPVFDAQTLVKALRALWRRSG